MQKATNNSPSELYDEEYKQDEIEFTAQHDVQTLLENIDIGKENAMVPPPPGPGELIYCQLCGQAMLPEHFSKDSWWRKYEFKWHVHRYCVEQTTNLCDRLTVGLLAERTPKEEIKVPEFSRKRLGGGRVKW